MNRKPTTGENGASLLESQCKDHKTPLQRGSAEAWLRRNCVHTVFCCRQWQPTVCAGGAADKLLAMVRAGFVCAQAGILSADKLLTVSPTYAEEMSENPSKGVELDDVIRCRFWGFYKSFEVSAALLDRFGACSQSSVSS